jgi:hypothetical protein
MAGPHKESHAGNRRPDHTDIHIMYLCHGHGVALMLSDHLLEELGERPASTQDL